jgi:hypothetical protein
MSGMQGWCSLSSAHSTKLLQSFCRTHGAVLTRIRITERFKKFFAINPTGVFEELLPSAGAPPPPDEPFYWHAVLLVGQCVCGLTCVGKAAQGLASCCLTDMPRSCRPSGYNNTGFFWYARNSWGPDWADGGTFR